MKLSFEKKDLLKSINISMKAVSSSTTMPVLKCILINAVYNEIKFISNDMEMAIVTNVRGKTEEEGLVAVDAKIFSEIVRKLPDDVVTIETNERLVVTIKCGKSLFNIPGLEGDAYPYPPEIEKNISLGMSQLSLKEMISSTIFSINISENNKLMTGELIEIKNNILRITALDGHRLALRKMSLSGEYEDVRVIVPGKTLSEISKLLSDNIDDQVRIFFSDNQILFEFDETCVYSRLIDGEYFNIDNMIKEDHSIKIVINKKEFYDCIDRAGLLIREGDNRPIILNAENGSMEISIQTTSGSMNENIETKKSGDDIRIGFNPRFLTDPLKVIDEEEISLYMTNGKSPCYIKDDNGEYLYLILPVNIM